MQNKNHAWTILLDVGGTGIKGCVSQLGIQILEEYQEFEARSDQSDEIIFSNFDRIIRTLGRNKNIQGIAFAFPGPFDYVHGVSLVQNIGKYDSIYGKPFPIELAKRNPDLKNTKMVFVHDTEAFALGCISVHPEMSRKKVFCLCIGTGCGSAFIQDGKIVKEGPDVPSNGWIYNSPYQKTIIDDYISKRGLEALSEEMTGNRLSGIVLSERALGGNTDALRVYQRFGERISEAIEPFLKLFHPDVLILGGNVSKGYPYFGHPLSGLCDRYGIRIQVETETSIMTMRGLKSCFSEN